MGVVGLGGGGVGRWGVSGRRIALRKVFVAFEVEVVVVRRDGWRGVGGRILGKGRRWG